jgi:cysteine desulfurase/selenocysteine lyase
LYGRAEHLERIAWHQQGGSTVEAVHANDLEPKDIPWRFEAGTPAVESVIGLAAAIKFLDSLGMDHVHSHQRNLVSYALKQIQARLPTMSVLGPVDKERTGPISMVQRTVSPHLLARGLSDGYQICARSGFHCAQPLHEFLNVPASLRLSFYVYNTTQEIDRTVDALERLLALNS